MASHAIASTSGISGLLAFRDSSWIIDSGASSHMTGSRDLYSRISQDIRSVSIADGRTCRVSGQGTIRATSQLTLDKALYVLEFPVNLLSISSITKHLNCFVTFFPFHCTFQDLQTGKRIGLGREKCQGVCLLVKDEIPRGFASLASTVEPSIIWHHRLGHSSHQKLQQALPWISVSSFQCESCELGNHHRATFHSLRLVRSKSPFELIHCDV